MSNDYCRPEEKVHVFPANTRMCKCGHVNVPAPTFKFNQTSSLKGVAQLRAMNKLRAKFELAKNSVPEDT